MRIPVAKDGFVFIKIFVGLTVVFYMTGYYLKSFYFLSGVSFLLMLFMLFFFRDPEREIIQNENLIIAPADGKILDIRKEKHQFLNSTSNVVKIFMSPLNVHIQRAPINGTVNFTKYQPGKFLPAYKDEADEQNEQNIICIRSHGSGTESFQILVKQIAGILARRIVCWCGEKDELKKGQKIGLIKFGSQVDLYLPENVEIKVKIGDKVKAGVSIIGEISP